jgi:hypothetical protein
MRRFLFTCPELTPKQLIKKVAILFLFGIIGTISLPINHVTALSGSEFKASRIIDDAVFFNKSTMSAQQIQEFLNSKVPMCDTWGTKPSGHSGYPTRADWGAANGNPAPYTCLRELVQDVPAITNSGSDLCKGSLSAGRKSAAEIIYDVSQACGINPQVLIVLLQKEQSLVTDDWPWPRQYRSATGYGCPDTAPCDAEFYGFYNQLYQAAKAYKRYAANPTNYNYRAGRNNTILYNPNASCGSSSVFIENQATANLYIYTPYQPNQAALNNLYGVGDSCSAYGNRNFWRMFNDWFGSTHAINSTIVLSKPLSTNVINNTVVAGDVISASYEVANLASYSVNAGALGICAQVNGAWYDFGLSDQNDIPANGKITINYSKQITMSGDLKISICSYHSNIGGWAGWFYPYDFTNSLARSVQFKVYENPLITSGITVTPTNPQAGQDVTVSFKVQNASNTPVSIGQMLVAARDPRGANIDFPSDLNVVVPANGEYVYSRTRTATIAGTYSFFIANYRTGWDMTYPQSSPGVNRNIMVKVY